MLAAFMCTTACATTGPVPARPAPIRITVFSASGGAAPGVGAATRTTVYDSPRTITQVLRLAPNAKIAEHYHPFYDETFVLQQGRLSLLLDGRSYDLGAGDFVVVPAGTTVSGVNTGDQEARVVVAFSGTGQSGPLTVVGAPHH